MSLSIFSAYDVEGLVGVAPDLDLLSPREREAWSAELWRRVAAPIGFEGELGEAIAEARRARPRLVGLHEAALFAFGRFVARRKTSDPPELVRARLEVLRALGRRAQAGGLWEVTADAAELPGQGCYAHASGELRRVFDRDGAPGYLGGALGGPAPVAEGPCGWSVPVRLVLGTFPWVYAGQLGREAPGLRWGALGEVSPALEAMRLSMSLLTPLGNLRQDARTVAVAAARYLRLTAPILAALPTWRAGDKGTAGRLYVRDGQLYAHHASLDVVTLTGPHGELSAVAHNAVMTRFAAFFALRGAVMRARAAWTPEMRTAADTNPDPTLRALREVA